MNKRQAKKVMLSYVLQMLEPVSTNEYLIEQSKDDNSDLERLEDARQQLQDEMLRRLGEDG